MHVPSVAPPGARAYAEVDEGDDVVWPAGPYAGDAGGAWSAVLAPEPGEYLVVGCAGRYPEGPGEGAVLGDEVGYAGGRGDALVVAASAGGEDDWAD